MVPLPDGTSDAAARAAGAARAGGRSLHFVRAKDGLPPGSPRTVAERTAELPDTVDVLLLDHLRSTWRSSALPSADGPLLARAGRTEPALADSAYLLRLTPLLGTRVLRADFWRAHEERLTTDDEPRAALAALLLAGRVSCLPHIAYEDRRLRPASLPPVTPEQHLAAVDRYEALLDLAQDRPAVYTVLYEIMVRDCLRAFARGAVPEPAAREFFLRAGSAAVRRRPEGYRRPAARRACAARCSKRAPTPTTGPSRPPITPAAPCGPRCAQVGGRRAR
ncbi:CDP-glycerol glycerophosphotransferase family protein OS=Streptomyces tendae OX=1932 GN=F3L20_28225 PE=3 SV=1 [Streptomyces tendae]